ncbi:MAG: hypothetical protein NTU80_08615 [Verrucomicrobia bacterium]|nr:hypothetical protein [Verrucomicrobiota bacterium]
MPTVATKKPIGRKRAAPVGKPAAPAKSKALALPVRRTPPPCAFTGADLLKRTDFGKGLDGAFVESALADRSL